MAVGPERIAVFAVRDVEEAERVAAQTPGLVLLAERGCRDVGGQVVPADCDAVQAGRDVGKAERSTGVAGGMVVAAAGAGTGTGRTAGRIGAGRRVADFPRPGGPSGDNTRQ